jgi:hypothetical protein
MMTVEDLTPEALKELLSQTVRPTGANARRRQEFADRFAIQTDEYDHIIKKRICETHDLSDIQMEMCRWAVGFFNPQKRIVRRMAVAYKRRPRRRIEGATKTENRKYADLMRDIGYDGETMEWQRDSVAMNRIVILVMPTEDDEGKPTIGFSVVTGAIAEVVPEPGLPITAPPGILCYRLPEASAHHVDPKTPVCVTVDARWWIWWNTAHQMVRVVEHGMGMFPGADMRSTRPRGTDWWDGSTGRGLTKTVAEVGMIAASMGWTRKQMCRKVLGLFTEDEGDEVPEGQTLTHPERPIVASGTGISLTVQDLIVPIDEFMKQIRALQDEAAELVTGAVSTLTDPDPSAGAEGERSLAGVHQHAFIEELRESQQMTLTVFERRMAILIAVLSTMLEMENAVDPDKMREGFRCVWPRLPLLDAPMARVKVWQEETTFGIADQVDALVEREGISEEEAEERLMAIAERRARLDEFRASRNQKADPGDGDPTNVELKEKPGESLQQTQGRAGGQSSGESRAAAAQ